MVGEDTGQKQKQNSQRQKTREGRRDRKRELVDPMGIAASPRKHCRSEPSVVPPPGSPLAHE